MEGNHDSSKGNNINGRLDQSPLLVQESIIQQQTSLKRNDKNNKTQMQLRKSNQHHQQQPQQQQLRHKWSDWSRCSSDCKRTRHRAHCDDIIAQQGRSSVTTSSPATNTNNNKQTTITADGANNNNNNNTNTKRNTVLTSETLLDREEDFLLKADQIEDEDYADEGDEEEEKDSCDSVDPSLTFQEQECRGDDCPILSLPLPPLIAAYGAEEELVETTLHTASQKSAINPQPTSPSNRRNYHHQRPITKQRPQDIKKGEASAPRTIRPSNLRLASKIPPTSGNGQQPTSSENVSFSMDQQQQQQEEQQLYFQRVNADTQQQYPFDKQLNGARSNFKLLPPFQHTTNASSSSASTWSTRNIWSMIGGGTGGVNLASVAGGGAGASTDLQLGWQTILIQWTILLGCLLLVVLLIMLIVRKLFFSTFKPSYHWMLAKETIKSTTSTKLGSASITNNHNSTSSASTTSTAIDCCASVATIDAGPLTVNLAPPSAGKHPAHAFNLQASGASHGLFTCPTQVVLDATGRAQHQSIGSGGTAGLLQKQQQHPYHMCYAPPHAGSNRGSKGQEMLVPGGCTTHSIGSNKTCMSSSTSSSTGKQADTNAMMPTAGATITHHCFVDSKGRASLVKKATAPTVAHHQASSIGQACSSSYFSNNLTSQQKPFESQNNDAIYISTYDTLNNNISTTHSNRSSAHYLQSQQQEYGQVSPTFLSTYCDAEADDDGFILDRDFILPTTTTTTNTSSNNTTTRNTSNKHNNNNYNNNNTSNSCSSSSNNSKQEPTNRKKQESKHWSPNVPETSNAPAPALDATIHDSSIKIMVINHHEEQEIQQQQQEGREEQEELEGAILNDPDLCSDDSTAGTCSPSVQSTTAPMLSHAASSSFEQAPDLEMDPIDNKNNHSPPTTATQPTTNSCSTPGSSNVSPAIHPGLQRIKVSGRSHRRNNSISSSKVLNLAYTDVVQSQPNSPMFVNQFKVKNKLSLATEHKIKPNLGAQTSTSGGHVSSIAKKFQDHNKLPECTEATPIAFVGNKQQRKQASHSYHHHNQQHQVIEVPYQQQHQQQQTTRANDLLNNDRRRGNFHDQEETTQDMHKDNEDDRHYYEEI